MTSPLLEWRPIDTCPKDVGVGVMLSDGNQVAPGAWSTWGGQSKFFWDFWDSASSFVPAYWMPFPPPPTNQAPEPKEAA